MGQRTIYTYILSFNHWFSILDFEFSILIVEHKPNIHILGPKKLVEHVSLLHDSFHFTTFKKIYIYSLAVLVAMWTHAVNSWYKINHFKFQSRNGYFHVLVENFLL